MFCRGSGEGTGLGFIGSGTQHVLALGGLSFGGEARLGACGVEYCGVLFV